MDTSCPVCGHVEREKGSLVYGLAPRNTLAPAKPDLNEIEKCVLFQMQFEEGCIESVLNSCCCNVLLEKYASLYGSMHVPLYALMPAD